jgi:mRNA interferase MazF
MIRGEIWWADLGLPFGSEPGFRRPIVIIQADAFNRSKIGTTVVASITTHLELSNAPGNVYLEKDESRIAKDGVVNISQIATLDRLRMSDKVSVLPQSTMAEIDYGLKLVLNLQ